MWGSIERGKETVFFFFFCEWCDQGGPEANLVSFSDTCRNIQILRDCPQILILFGYLLMKYAKLWRERERERYRMALSRDYGKVGVQKLSLLL